MASESPNPIRVPIKRHNHRFNLKTLFCCLVITTIFTSFLFGGFATDYYQRDTVIRDITPDKKHFIPVKFYIYNNYSQKIQQYFEGCNASSDRGIDYKNRYSHLGGQYFSVDRLKKHRWYDPNLGINDADIVILPMFLSMALDGSCGQSINVSKEQSRTDFQRMFTDFRFFHELWLNYRTNATQYKYLLIAPNFALCHRVLFTEFRKSMASAGFHTMVGHFENKAKCFWSPNENLTNTIVLTYTMPPSITYNEYKMYENVAFAIENFYQRRYSLFYMGSAYTTEHFEQYKDRRLAIKYMSILATMEEATHHFGVATDYYKSDRTNLLLPLCDTDLTAMPCALTESNKQTINANNELYLYGLKNSKFNLMIHGDSPTSGKFYDSIAFNQINIFIGIDQSEICTYLPFCNVIPYEKFAFFLPIEEFRDETKGIQLLQNIIHSTSEQTLNSMIRTLIFYKKYLLWNHPQSLVVDNVMREPELNSQNTIRTSKSDKHNNAIFNGHKKNSNIKVSDNYKSIKPIRSGHSFSENDIIKTENKTLLLVAGHGHSGTTYIQQFMADVNHVILGSLSVFGLFEPTHLQRMKDLIRYHRYSSLNISDVILFLSFILLFVFAVHCCYFTRDEPVNP